MNLKSIGLSILRFVIADCCIGSGRTKMVEHPSPNEEDLGSRPCAFLLISASSKKISYRAVALFIFEEM